MLGTARHILQVTRLNCWTFKSGLRLITWIQEVADKYKTPLRLFLYSVVCNLKSAPYNP